MSECTLFIYRDFPEVAQLIHNEEEKFRDVPISERIAAILHLSDFAHQVIERSSCRDEIRAMLSREKEEERAAFRKFFRDYRARLMADSLTPHSPRLEEAVE